MIDFYVYVFFRPDGSPCYIGKGRRRRWKENLSRPRNRHLANIIKAAGGELPVVKIRQNLTDAQAREIEVALIKAIGRKETGGPLVNMTAGGEGVSGRKMPESERRFRRRIMGSPEVRSKLSAAHKGQPSFRKGKKTTPEIVQKISAAKTGTTASEETKLKMSIAQIERWTDPRKRTVQSKIQLERYSDPEERRRTGEAISAALARPECKENNIARAHRRWAVLGRREEASKTSLERYSDPQEREKHSERMKLWWAERRAAMEAHRASS